MFLNTECGNVEPWNPIQYIYSCFVISPCFAISWNLMTRHFITLHHALQFSICLFGREFIFWVVQNYWKSGPQTIKTILNCLNFIATFQPCGPYQAIKIITKRFQRFSIFQWNIFRESSWEIDRKWKLLNYMSRPQNSFWTPH